MHETLDPVVAGIRGSTLVNLTTTTPNEARELAGWAAEHGVRYLDGAIMATPPMIGTAEASILYSGSREVFDDARPVLDRWATSTYDGADSGLASLFDLAMLSGMYTMFAGFLHGAAMVGSVGVTATELSHSHIVRASEEQGVNPAPIAAVRELISKQIAKGYGAESSARLYESLRADRTERADRAATLRPAWSAPADPAARCATQPGP